MHHFFIDSLFFKEYYVKISKFFLTGSTGPQSFSSTKVRRSKFEYGALGLVLIISPSFELGIVYHFFYGLLVLQGIFYQNLKFFSQQVPKVSIQPEFIGTCLNLEHLGLFRSYLPHPNLESGTIFLWTPYSLRNILSKFKFFSQLARLVGNCFNQFVGPACIEH